MSLAAEHQVDDEAVDVAIVTTRLCRKLLAVALGAAAGIVAALPAGGQDRTDERVIGRSLESVFIRCWERPWEDWRDRGITVRRPAHLEMYNPSADVTLHICLFDAICRQILHSGRIPPRMKLRVDACTDEDVGLVYLIYERGPAYLLEDVLASFTKRVTLPIHLGYYPP